jgi:thymidylate synthase (FAD)
MRVSILAMTDLHTNTAEVHTDGVWSPDSMYDDASALAEFAGRLCYTSWNRPNPATATNEGYIANIIAQNHFSVLEHGTVSFLIADVSRSLTHELIRHRHGSFSQLSQRYVDMAGVMPVIPPLYQDMWENDDTKPISETQGIVEALWNHAVSAYDQLYAIWHARLMARGIPSLKATKMAREAARCVLPNATPTQLVVTMNHRSLREFIEKRATIHADAEIRGLAVAIYRLLVMVEPNLYADFIEVVEYVGETMPITVVNHIARDDES